MNVDITIYCLTYNHVDYIRDALEGFLMQKTSYTYNVFVYDDASTDGTSDILREYMEKYPEIFDVYISPRNIYNLPDREMIMHKLYEKHIVGRYVAWCEGDDYWTDSNKLQKQIDFMEQNAECSMVAHGAYWWDCQTGKLKDYNPYNENRYLAEEEVILQPQGNLPTASLVMRRDVFIRDVKFPKCDVGDIPMQLYALCKGKIYYFNCQMSMYRYRHTGSWTKEIEGTFEKNSIHAYRMIHFMEEYDQYSHGIYHEFIRRRCAYYLYSRIYTYQFMDVNDYFDRMYKLKGKLERSERGLIKNQCRIFELFKENGVIRDSEREIILQFKYVVIMGTGDYSKYITHLLEANDISYVGYVVTTVAGNANLGGRKIWELHKYPYSREDTLVIVGISQNSEKSVMESLKKNEFYNVMTPLWPYDSYLTRRKNERAIAVGDNTCL